MARNLVILGGTGRMGKWFARFFRDRGFNVFISSRSPEKGALVAKEIAVEYVKNGLNIFHDADIVLIATPIGATAKTIREVSKSMKVGAILFDIASIKGEIIEALEETGGLGIRTLSVHPLFGPGVKSIDGKRVLIIPVSDDPELITEVSGLFKGAKIQIVESGEDHDRMMALTLALPHFLNITFGKILSKFDIKMLKKYEGTTFILQLLISESVISEDPDFYYEIQRQNTFFTKILDDLIEVVKENALIVKNNNKTKFIKEFEKIREAFSRDPTFLQAYNKFNKAIDAIVKQ